MYFLQSKLGYSKRANQENMEGAETGEEMTKPGSQNSGKRIELAKDYCETNQFFLASCRSPRLKIIFMHFNHSMSLFFYLLIQEVAPSSLSNRQHQKSHQWVKCCRIFARSTPNLFIRFSVNDALRKCKCLSMLQECLSMLHHKINDTSFKSK